ncbi:MULTISPECIES: ATP-binding cassette domain-containing protein [unclassified Anaerotruncus]|uniref:ATP-binding cassette domain-containing protein n=1 Tax=Anaerotruncus sp. 1XD42-93 TaxID=2320853 RepID=UPI000EA00E68|nr:ATP-binding cassette domain-containing protein [Anaerotruncus sp. 1XD42-93]RKJ96043.1 ATP-binding cassette domain-containing protein [Anaerotruncus sp. 1XD22-93]
MLELSRIVKSFGSSRVLDGVNLKVDAGEAVCIAGANAAGKTTLLTIAAGMQKPDSGSVAAEGKLGYVSQEPALFGEMTVRDHLRLWYAANNLPEKLLFSASAPETMLGLHLHARKRADRLSGGVRKRLSIACALAGDPPGLLLDEPFTALDLQTKTDILALLSDLKQRRKGLLFTSHDPSAVAAAADRVLLLRDGAISGEIRLAGEQEDRIAQVIALLSQT